MRSASRPSRLIRGVRREFDHGFAHNHGVVVAEYGLRPRDLRVAGRQGAKDEVGARQTLAELAWVLVERNRHHDEFALDAKAVGSAEDGFAGRRRGRRQVQPAVRGNRVSLWPGGHDARAHGAADEEQTEGESGGGGESMHAALIKRAAASLPSC